MIKLLAIALLASDSFAVMLKGSSGGEVDYRLLGSSLLIMFGIFILGLSGILFTQSRLFKFFVSDAPKAALTFFVYPLTALVVFVVVINIHKSLESSPAAELVGKWTGSKSVTVVAKSGATALNSKPLQLVVHTGLKTPEEYGYKSKYSFADIK